MSTPDITPATETPVVPQRRNRRSNGSVTEANGASFSVTFAYDKATPGTFVFKEVPDPKLGDLYQRIIGSLYAQKGPVIAKLGKVPANAIVTITFV